MGQRGNLCEIFVGVWRLVLRVATCSGASLSPVSVILRVGGERGCRNVWLVLKGGHEGYVTKHTLFIFGIELCAFEVFLEGGDCSVQYIVDLVHFVSLYITVFWMGVG